MQPWGSFLLLFASRVEYVPEVVALLSIRNVPDLIALLLLHRSLHFAISAKKVEKTWDGITRTSNSLGDNKGFLVLFRYQERTDANLFFHTGTWQTPDYRRWGFTTINGQKEGSWVGWHGSIYLSSYFPSRGLEQSGVITP